MKKAIKYGLIVSILLLSLTACTKEQEQEPPVTDSQAETITTPEPEQTTPEQPEQITTPEPVQQEPEKADPAPVEPEQQQDQVVFTEVNETVYAASTVNIRAGYTIGSDKTGSLTWGQSVTRTGIGTGEAEGWSRVQLSDGSTAYISSQYLSTTKPASSSTSSGSGSSGSSGGNSGSSGQTPDQPSQPSGNQSSYGSEQAIQGLIDWAEENGSEDFNPGNRPGAVEVPGGWVVPDMNVQ